MKQRLLRFLSTVRDYLRRRFRDAAHWVDDPWERNFYIALIASIATVTLLYVTNQEYLLVPVGGLAISVTGGVGMRAPKDTRIREISTELIGISIGVVAIDGLYQIRSYQQYKQAIIYQIGSQSNDFALEAARIASLEGWLFDGSLRGAPLPRANLQGAYLQRANLRDANLAYADLRDANMRRAILQDAKLAYADLRDADLSDAILTGAHLTSASLQTAKLGGAKLQGAHMSNARLQGADLVWANLEGANLVHANLQGVHYNSRTVWPDGFTPTDEMIFWDTPSMEMQRE